MKPDIELPPGYVWNEDINCIDFVHEDGYNENVAWVDKTFSRSWEAVYAPVGVTSRLVRRHVDTEHEGWALLVAWLLLGMDVEDVR